MDFIDLGIFVGLMLSGVLIASPVAYKLGYRAAAREMPEIIEDSWAEILEENNVSSK